MVTLASCSPKNGGFQDRLHFAAYGDYRSNLAAVRESQSTTNSPCDCDSLQKIGPTRNLKTMHKATSDRVLAANALHWLST